MTRRSRDCGLAAFCCERRQRKNFGKSRRTPTLSIGCGGVGTAKRSTSPSATVRGTPRCFGKVSADGSGLQTVFEGTATDYFSSFSPDNTRRYFAGLLENNTTPPRIAFLDTMTGQARTLVDLNPSFRNLTLAPAERIEGTNQYGEQWYGYLVKPLGYTPGVRYPLIVTTYRSGDYFLRGASGDQNPIQVYAAKGFAVFCFDMGRLRNIRPGHFEETILEWSSPTASLESAIDLLNNRGVIDPERVGIAGFSHGEEIAGYAVLHTNLFRAAIGAALYDPCFYFIGGAEWWDAFKNIGLGGGRRARQIEVGRDRHARPCGPDPHRHP